MKLISCSIILLFLFTAGKLSAQHHHGGTHDNAERKDPAIAALLSIQPLPVAIGNFYAGDWSRGIIYTTAELILFIPAAVLLGRNNWGFGMHNYSFHNYEDNRRSWTNSERNRFYYFLTGYILVKIISAFDAGYSAEIFNQNMSMGYDFENSSLILSLNIPLE